MQNRRKLWLTLSGAQIKNGDSKINKYIKPNNTWYSKKKSRAHCTKTTVKMAGQKQKQTESKYFSGIHASNKDDSKLEQSERHGAEY